MTLNSETILVVVSLFVMFVFVCTAGFQQGFVQWNDENVGNSNAKGGTLPDGVYDDNTNISFCCR